MALVPATAPGQIHASPNGSTTADGTNPLDPVTIQRAISLSLEDEFIRLQQGTYPITDTIFIAPSITLQAGWNVDFTAQTSDPSLTTLMGDGTTDRVITFDPTSDDGVLIIDSVTITNGNAENSPTRPGYGGGILSTGGTLTITNSTISGNVGRESDREFGNDTSGFGGGIYSFGTVDISNSTISGNTATSASNPGLGLYPNAGGGGGGLYVGFDPNSGTGATIDVTILNSTISGNTANAAADPNMAGAGSTDSRGGGIYIGPNPEDDLFGGEPTVGIAINISGSTISDNVVKAGDEFAGQGGGMFIGLGGIIADTGATITIDDTLIDNNTASDATTGFIELGSQAQGGGLYLEPPSGAVITITNSTISNNTADRNGGNQFGTGGGFYFSGGTVSIDGTTITGNIASDGGQGGRGGGIESIGTSLTITNSTISDNQAIDNPIVPAANVIGDGGGLWIQDDNSMATITITNTELLDNITADTTNSTTRGEQAGFDLDPTNVARIYHNTFSGPTGTGRSTMLITQGTYDIQNNIFSGAEVGILTQNTPSGLVNFNLFNVTSTRIDDTGGGLLDGGSNADGDPQFEDSANGDVRIKDTSPARDTGNPTLGVTKDKNGNDRDEMPDKGAHEYREPQQFFDYGDAPGTYLTLLASDGARHLVNTGSPLPRLGNIDTEPDGFPGATADGDDTDGSSDDEDGVTWEVGAFSPCSDNAIAGIGQNAITVKARGGGFLSLWVDLNEDGTFDGPDERLINARALPAQDGDVPISYTLPSSSFYQTYARVRVTSAEGAISPSGQLGDGEVEDYLVTRLQNSNYELIMSVRDTLGDELKEVKANTPFIVELRIIGIGPEELKAIETSFSIHEVYATSGFQPNKSRVATSKFNGLIDEVSSLTIAEGNGAPNNDFIQWRTVAPIPNTVDRTLRLEMELQTPYDGTDKFLGYQFKFSEACADTIVTDVKDPRKFLLFDRITPQLSELPVIILSDVPNPPVQANRGDSEVGYDVNRDDIVNVADIITLVTGDSGDFPDDTPSARQND